ncbi:MAG: hypothetical protein H7246_02460 [Phycisphaerae bacterium]|nr:hypothetical protein [Saprospiraceae bacterium]
MTLILTPLTVGATIYLTEFFKSPNPKIEFVTPIVASKSSIESPSDSIRLWIIKDPYLAETIWKNPILMNSKSPKEWLNGYGPWNEECETTFETLIEAYRKKVRKGEILRWNEKAVTKSEYYVSKAGYWTTETQNNPYGQPGTIQQTVYRQPEYSNRNIPVQVFESSEPANKVLTILNEFTSEIERVKNANTIRTGKIDFKVGVLNQGASDGVIFRDAILKFEKGELYVTAQSFSAIGAHSFSEIIFSSGTDFSGESEARKLTDEAAIKASFAKMVQENKAIPFELILTLSEKKASIAGVIPAAKNNQD